MSTREHKIYKVTFIGAVVNVLLSIAKLVAGLLGHSAAMLADAIHSVSDLATDLAVVVFVRIASKPRDEDHDFGHGKFETLSSIIVGIALIGIGFGILRYGFFEIVAIINGNSIPEPNMLAFWAAIVSIIVKEILFRYTIIRGKSLSSPAVVANAWHHRSDAFSSIGTAIGIGGAILLGDNWRVLDPIAAIIVSIIVIKAGIEFVLPGVNELLEKSLPKDVEEEIIKIIKRNEKVCDPHNLRTRNIGTSYAIEVHIRLSGDMNVKEAHELTQNIESQIKERYGQRTHIIIHVEPIKCESEQ
ncbi:MAG: cation transporter [Kiritimatiellae bacterium]|nr:cation transporter [Kiritimatiellia bacterium]